MFYSHRCFHSLSLGLALVACLSAPTWAASPDHDYETVVPAPQSVVSVPVAPLNPTGIATSPLAISGKPTRPRPRMRFVMRDGSVLIGQVLGFDGQMYALQMPHSTVLARRDFFSAVTPVTTALSKSATARAVRRIGARY